MTNPNDSIGSSTKYKRATTDPHSNLAPFQVGGLSKREYFAAMRKEPNYSSELTLPQSWAEVIMESKMPEGTTMESIKWWCLAHEKFAVMKADALITALNEAK